MGAIREEWVFCFVLRGIVHGGGTQPTPIRTYHIIAHRLTPPASTCISLYETFLLSCRNHSVCPAHLMGAWEWPSITDTQKLVYKYPLGGMGGPWGNSDTCALYHFLGFTSGIKFQSPQ